jgi:hypothetical protein
MDESFDIPVTYKGKEYLFPATLNSAGYSYRIQVDVFGNSLRFEPDEERNFRAVLGNSDLQHADKVDRSLIEEIAAVLVVLFRD